MESVPGTSRGPPRCGWRSRCCARATCARRLSPGLRQPSAPHHRAFSDHPACTRRQLGLWVLRRFGVTRPLRSRSLLAPSSFSAPRASAHPWESNGALIRLFESLDQPHSCCTGLSRSADAITSLMPSSSLSPPAACPSHCSHTPQYLCLSRLCTSPIG